MSDNIPEEIQVQILKWLPAKPLLRFRCVCKWWKEIIDSHSFIQQHLALQKPQFLIAYEEPEFLVLDPQTLPLIDTVSYPFERKFHLINTLHGLVLLYNENENNLLLWNPTIRKLFSLSLPDTILPFGCHYEELVLIHAFSGFWIDPCCYNSFKIIIFKLYTDEEPRIGVLYSSIERGWRVLPVEEMNMYMPFYQDGYLSRVMRMIGVAAYWRARSINSLSVQGKRYFPAVIVSFDFVQERFEIIELPQLRHMNYSGSYHPLHTDWQDTLSLVYWDEDAPHRCDVYSRREGEWVNMFSFSFFPTLIRRVWAVDEMEGRCRVLAIIGDGDGDGDGDGWSLVAYDSRDGCITLKSGLWAIEQIYIAYDFVESLVFPST